MDSPPPGLPTADTGSRSSPRSNMAVVWLLLGLMVALLRRFWAMSSACVLMLVVLYWTMGSAVALILVVFGATGVLYHAGDRLLYHPDQPATARLFVPSPSIFGLPFESVFIHSADRTRLHMFLIKQENPVVAKSSPTILFLHGNAGNIGHRLPNAKKMFSKLGVNVCLLEYRGYGHSDGNPSEDGLCADAQAALDFLVARSDIDPAKIVIFGRSLGGAVAIDLSSRAENRQRIACVLLENTFTSIPDVARHLFAFRIIKALPNWFYKNQFKSRWKICGVSAPTLFLSGLCDNLIPSRMMNDLFEACGAETKRMARFRGGTHNETWMCQQYFETIAYFVHEVAGLRPPETEVGGAVFRRIATPPPEMTDAVNIIL